MYKLLLTLCLATVALAEPWGYSAYHGHGHGHYAAHLPGLSQHHAGGGHSYQSGTHLGKRSAEPHGYFHGHHGYHGHHAHAHGSATLADGELSVTHPGGGTSSVSGHSLGKRSAEHHGYFHGHHGYHGHHGLHHEHPAAAGLDTTLTVEHPNGGSSSVSGHSLGKRSAEPWGYGHGYGHGHHGSHGHHGAHVSAVHGTGVAGHPGGATSYVAGSGPGIGKRSADAEPTVWGLPNGAGGFVGQHSNGAGAHVYGHLDNYHHGYGHGFHHGKRSAEAEPIVWGAQNGHGGFVGQHGNGADGAHVYGHGHHGYLGYGHGYGYGHGHGKRSADAEPIVWGAKNGHGGWVGQAIPAHGHGHGHGYGGHHGFHHG